MGDALVLTGPADGEVAELGAQGGGFIEVDGDAQFVGHAPAQLPCHHGTLVERDAPDGDEGQHVGGSDAGVGAVVTAHVDELLGGLHSEEGGFGHCLRLTGKGDDGAVGSLAGVDVEHLSTADAADGVGDLSDDVLVAALAEVGHALHDSIHWCNCSKSISISRGTPYWSMSCSGIQK